MSPSSEDLLFARYRDTGCTDALASVFDQTAAELYRVAVHLVRDQHLAEDLVQTTFLNAIDDREAWDDSQSVLPWLLGILANRARYWLRERRRKLSADALAVKDVADPIDVAADREWSETLASGIRSLPEPYRHVLVLHLEHDLSPKEIADAHDLSASTVRTQLARGLDLLRKALPAGFAAATMVGVLPASMMQVLKAAVLAQASAGTTGATIGAGSTVSSVLGALVMKKMTLVCAIAVLAIISTRLGLWSEATGSGPLNEPGPSAVAVNSDEGDLVKADSVNADPSRQVIADAEIETEPVGTVSLRVLWSDRSPAAGIGVRLLPWDGENGRAYKIQSTTDANGCILWNRVSVGRVTLYVDRVDKISKIDLKSGAHEECEVVLPSGVQVGGRVVDLNGDPVSGAELWLHHNTSELGHKVATSDAHGRFLLRDLESKRGHGLQARAPGHAPSYPVFVDTSLGDRNDIEMVLEGPGASIRGKVTRPDGSPIVDAVVEVRPGLGQRTNENGALVRAPSILRLRTDDKGEFLASGQNINDVYVSVRAKGMGVWKEQVLLKAAQEGLVNITLPLGGSVKGRVTDSDGNAIADVPVGYAIWYKDFDFARTKTKPDGSFELRGLSEGVRSIRAGNKKHGSSRAKLQIVAGEVTEHDFALSDGGNEKRLKGRVINEEGEPMVGWRVFLRDQHWKSAWSGSETIDENGEFKFDNCPDLGMTLRLFDSSAPGEPGQFRAQAYRFESSLLCVVAAKASRFASPQTCCRRFL